MIRYELNGVDLDRWRPQVPTAWFSQVTVNRAVVTLPGRHGQQRVGKPTYGPQLDVLTLLVEKPADRSLEAEVAALVATFTARDLVLARTSEEHTLTATPELVSLVPGDYIPGHHAFYTATLRRDDPFWRGPATTSTLTPATGTIPLLALEGSTAPIPDAVIQVRPASGGSVSQVTATDPVSGTGLHWAGSLPAGQSLYLDAANLTARRSASTSAWQTGGTDVTGGLDYPVAGPLVLTPTWTTEPDIRTVSIELQIVGSGSRTTSVRAARSHL